jgi:hypothetical protein
VSSNPPTNRAAVSDIRTHRFVRRDQHGVAPDAYVSYFENVGGEQLMFFRRRDEQHATLWHSSHACKPFRIAANLQPPRTIRLDGDELDWLNACRRASGLVPHLPRPVDVPAEPPEGPLHRAVVTTYEQQIRQGLSAVFSSTPEDEFVAMLAELVDRVSRAAAARLIGSAAPPADTAPSVPHAPPTPLRELPTPAARTPRRRVSRGNRAGPAAAP